MTVSKELLEILACPVCKEEVNYDATAQTITCQGCGRIYPVKNDIPVMLEEEATLPEKKEAEESEPEEQNESS